MGKNKQNKKKNNNKKEEVPKEEQLDSAVADEGKENKWESLFTDSLLPSDLPPMSPLETHPSLSPLETHPPSFLDDTAADANADNHDDLSVEGMKLNEAEREKRKPATWKEAGRWWDGQCAELSNLTNNMISLNLSPSQAFLAAFRTIKANNEREDQVRKYKMAENAREYGAKPLLDKSERRQRTAESHPDTEIHAYSLEEYKSLAKEWKDKQKTYIRSGRFNDLQSCQASAEGTAEGSVQQPGPMQPLQQEQLQKQQEPGPSSRPSEPPVSSLPARPPQPARNMDEYVRLSLFCHDDMYTAIELKWETPMMRLKENERIRNKVTREIARKVGRTPKNLLYRYKGKNIRDTDTPVSLGMVNDDKIQVIEAPPTRRH